MTELENFLIIGTAGHIDHGKTELIRRLTGIDTDRLKEEKERGITIDLGFAYVSLKSGMRVGIVDVPGHERFIKNMLAGASGIDFLLLVVAADEGVMPQTVEHLNICKLLKISEGIVVITKVDLVDEEFLELVQEDVLEFVEGTFLENAPIIPLSSITGQGFPELLDVLNDLVPAVTSRSTTKPFRMHIDRSFLIKGFGQVVTGTVCSGTIQTGEILKLLPANNTVKVRNIQVHHETVKQGQAGQRMAINVQSNEKLAIERGDVLCADGSFSAHLMLNVSIQLLKDSPTPLKKRTRVRLYLGTSEILARIIPLEGESIQPGEMQIAQLRLEAKAVAAPGDPFVIRSYSPLVTIGGGTVLETSPQKRNSLSPQDMKRYHQALTASVKDYLILAIEGTQFYGLEYLELKRRVGVTEEELKTSLMEVKSEKVIFQAGNEFGPLFSAAQLEELRKKMAEELQQYHHSHRLAKGMPKEELRSKFHYLSPNSFSEVSSHLVEQGVISFEDGLFHLPDFVIRKTDAEEILSTKIQAFIKESSFRAPTRAEIVTHLKEAEGKVLPVLQYLIEDGKIILLKSQFYYDSQTLKKMIEESVVFMMENTSLEISQLKEMFQLTRKHAIPFLEHLDEQGLTERRDSQRILKKRNYSSQ